MNKFTKLLLILLIILAVITSLLQIFLPRKKDSVLLTTETPVELGLDRGIQSSTEKIDDQGLLDIEFSEKVIDHVEKYPWYEDFPIITPKHIVVYDYNLESFRIRLKISKSSPLEERVLAQEEAVRDLKEKLANPNKWKHHFLYSEE